MAEAILTGVIKAGAASPGDIVASDVVEARRDYIAATHGVATTSDNVEALKEAEIAVLAVKPQNLGEVLAGLTGKGAPGQAVLSIVAGASIRAVSAGLGHDRVIRAMPNTPGQVGAGITVWTCTGSVTATQRQAAAGILQALGEEVAVQDEKLIDMATALSAGGPAYVFLFIEALTDAGVYLGMARDLAARLAAQTVLGSARMVLETGQHPAQLRDMVTSPGGTTAEALLQMEEGGFRATMLKAVTAAYRKARALGDGIDS